MVLTLGSPIVFDLASYIHRSMWHESLLLLAGHLSIISNHLASELLRSILKFETPYEGILQRNLFLATDCLADDVQVDPALRDEVLSRLAELLQHEAPQVRNGTLERYQRLAVTRYRDAAISALTIIYPLGKPEEIDDISADVRLNIGTALVYLKELPKAQRILWPLEERRFRSANINITHLRRVRFEGWPDLADDYLLQLEGDKQRGFHIGAADDLSECILGPVDSGLALRVVGTDRLLKIIAELELRPSMENYVPALHWIAALVRETDTRGQIAELMTEEYPTYIRNMAATRLLDSEHRESAIVVLRELVDAEPEVAPDAALALMQSGLDVEIKSDTFYDIALIVENQTAIVAIETLFKAGKQLLGLSAALHFLLSARVSYGKSYFALQVAQVLLNYGQIDIGREVATWIALKAGSNLRFEASELLLDMGLVEKSIPLLQYIAYETFSGASQSACQRLLVLRELERVYPVLQRVSDYGKGDLRYQACLALAFVEQSQLHVGTYDKTENSKEAILRERRFEYGRVERRLCEISMQALEDLEPSDAFESAARDLGFIILRSILESENTQIKELEELLLCEGPAIRIVAAQLFLRAGQIEVAKSHIVEIIRSDELRASAIVRRRAVKSLEVIVGGDVIDVMLAALSDDDDFVRRGAARALGRLGDRSAVDALVVALDDTNRGVRRLAASALGELGDRSAVDALVVALSDDDDSVRGSAAPALGELGDRSAVDALMVALSDDDDFVRQYAARALGELGDRSAVDALVVALSDDDDFVRQYAARALGELGDRSAVDALMVALSDDDDFVRQYAARALGQLGDRSTVDALVVALSDVDDSVRSEAARALGKLEYEPEIIRFVKALSETDDRVRSSAARTLGTLGDRSAIDSLVLDSGKKRAYAR